MATNGKLLQTNNMGSVEQFECPYVVSVDYSLLGRIEFPFWQRERAVAVFLDNRSDGYACMLTIKRG